MREGAFMASEGNFEIRIHGRGGHASMPEDLVDPLVAGAEVILALQTVVARNVPPSRSAVVSCTEIVTDGSRNAVRTEVVIRGDTRSYTPEVREILERRIREICEGVCAAHGAGCTVSYTHEFEPTVNRPDCVEAAARTARGLVGPERVNTDEFCRRRTLMVVSGWAENIESWIEDLRRSRPVFHSEADFQHALAWTAHLSDPSLRIRLETRLVLNTRLDLLISRPAHGEHLALELKYLTAAWTGEVGGERFALLNQGAQDIRAYDVVKDIERVERLVGREPRWSGAVLVLTNDAGYWTRPGHGRATNAEAFRIYEHQRITGRRAWGPNTGVGTTKKREAAIEVARDYTCRWAEYSRVPGDRGRFRLLALSMP